MQTRVLTLNRGEHGSNVLYRLSQGSHLRFTLGASLFGSESDVKLYTNCGARKEGEEEYSVWPIDTDLPLTTAGPSKYHAMLGEEKVASGWFQIDPKLMVGPPDNRRELPLDAITCCTYLTKLLGPLSTWRAKLEVARASGYNMIHLTPIQALGQSHSAYSLADQLKCMETMREREDGLLPTYEDVGRLTAELKSDWGMLTIGDVVWNHTANNSQWVQDHPECGYNLTNSPHLIPAYILDRALADFGAKVALGDYANEGLPAHIHKEDQLSTLRHLIWTQVMNTLSIDRTHMHSAVDALIGHVKYERVADDGLRLVEYTKDRPLFPRYFTDPLATPTPTGEEIVADVELSSHCLAYNGWVMAYNPLDNFAEEGSHVYLSRSLIAWGDSVKLRFGDSHSDCPFLWEHMAEYTRKCASVFDGLRLDNCHNTPIHVAEYLLSEARRVNPNLYVVAELFTGREEVDHEFVNRLGITSLIREAQSAPDAHELGRLVYKYGGRSIGAFHRPISRPLMPALAHACLMDITHDNKCPVQTRSVIDLLPTAGLVSMACCATGSSRGYDELVDYHVHVVYETRQYRALSSDKSPANVSPDSGIIRAKAVLNALHSRMAHDGYDEIYVDQKTPHTVCVTRHRPANHDSIIMLARTAFGANAAADRHNEDIVIEVGGRVDSVLFEMRMCFDGETVDDSKNGEYITGMAQFSAIVEENISVSSSTMVAVHSSDNTSTIRVIDLPPGGVVAIQISLPSSTVANVHSLRRQLAIFGYNIEMSSCDAQDDANSLTMLHATLAKLPLRTFNRVLYRCHDEEMAESNGQSGVYEIPHFTKFVYCGLAGLMPLLDKISREDDLAHPFCDNVRQGDWLVDYIIGRLAGHEETKELAAWFTHQFLPYRSLPHYLKPAYFDAIVTGAYAHICHHALTLMSPTASMSNDSLAGALALSTLSFVSVCDSALLPRLAHDTTNANKLTIAAGLPHFSHGLFRCWGRDTFIALRGCLLVNGRFEEAADIIVAFGGALRHGLIPNLLGGGTHARYNCRDAVWWWLQAVVDYVDMRGGEEGKAILQRDVNRLYPNDDDESYAHELVQPLHATMQEALNRHFGGIAYRERNAGHGIDEHMTDLGFNVEAFVDRERGFVCGGNQHNCGTWMDKMGGSGKAGNKGVPATPRDGGAIELQGLCYSVLRHLQDWHADRARYPYACVEHDGTAWTWQEWADRLQSHIVDSYVVPLDLSSPLVDQPNPDLVNLRGIIKDTWGSSMSYTDYQLRPNFVVALAVSPALFPIDIAWRALDVAKERLVAPLGMRTLDTKDWEYRGDYHNDDDSENRATAQGWNYHQGPEWVWLMGYYLRARIAVARLSKSAEKMTEAKHEVSLILARHNVHLHSDIWRSLPELTNSDGALCQHSCPAQAWSVGCILEAMHDLRNC